MSEAEAREIKIWDRYKSNKRYSHININFTMSECLLPNLRAQYQIWNQYELWSSTLSERICWWLGGESVIIPIYAPKYKVMFHLYEFISSFLCFVEIGFAQLVPNSYIHLIWFLTFYYECGVEPSRLLIFHVQFKSVGRTRIWTTK